MTSLAPQAGTDMFMLERERERRGRGWGGVELQAKTLRYIPFFYLLSVSPVPLYRPTRSIHPLKVWNCQLGFLRPVQPEPSQPTEGPSTILVNKYIIDFPFYTYHKRSPPNPINVRPYRIIFLLLLPHLGRVLISGIVLL
eukprot:17752_4